MCANSGGIKRVRFSLVQLLVLVTGMFIGTANAASLTAEVDRETVVDGESVVLYITGSDLTGIPDTSLLLPNFRIIQSGVSSSESIVNGQRTRGYKVRLELQAKNTGAAQIPAFTVDGVSSDPIVINVVPRGTPGVEPRDKVFVELSVDNDSPYVQEQVILSLKIFDDGNLASADPSIVGNGDIQVERLPLSGEQLEEKDGVRYRVHTFRYALFPQKSGEINIESVSIPASVRDKSYGGNLILRNTPTRRIELRTEPLQLQVKPRASSNTSSWWLPVKALDLKHQWSEDINTAKAGEPFTLTFELSGTGATSTQLPEIPVPDVPGLKIYTDTPQLTSRPEQNNLVSVRREKWSVIPNKAGLLTLPEIVIKWWDTEEDIEKQVVLPAQSLNIAAGEAADGQAIEQAKAPEVTAADLAGIERQAEVSSSEDDLAGGEVLSLSPSDSNLIDQTASSVGLVNRLWQWVAMAAMAAWFVTLICWWWSSRSRVTDRSEKEYTHENEGALWKNVKALSRGRDIKAYNTAVVQWAQSHWPNTPVHNLPEVGIRLGSQELTTTMRHLDQQRYSGHQNNGPLALTEIQAQLERALKNEQQRQSGVASNALPQL